MDCFATFSASRLPNAEDRQALRADVDRVEQRTDEHALTAGDGGYAPARSLRKAFPLLRPFPFDRDLRWHFDVGERRWWPANARVHLRAIQIEGAGEARAIPQIDRQVQRTL